MALSNSFRQFCGRDSFSTGADALVCLSQDSLLYEEWRRDGVDATLTEAGLVQAFLDDGEAERALASQRALGDVRVLTGPAIPRWEPALRGAGVQSALLVDDDCLVDPEALVLSLAAHLHASGTLIEESTTVSDFVVERGCVRTVAVEGEPLDCARLVVARGVSSDAALASLGIRILMQAGKGYRFSTTLPIPRRRPLYLGDKHVAASSHRGSTRIAGTMKVSGRHLRLDWRRIEAIARASTLYLGDWFESLDQLMDRIEHPWVGRRPMLPDGLPLIDRAPGLDNVYVATGHGMLGVTLAPPTAAALARFVTEGVRPPVLEPFAFHPARRLVR